MDSAMLESNCCEAWGRYRGLTRAPGYRFLKPTPDRFTELQHPPLSAADRQFLALSISAIDGVTCLDALRQIDRFMADPSFSG